MPSPFPGMDPYLEGAAWESFHAALIDEMGRQLAPRVRPKYFVRVERRFVTDGADSPDEISITARDVYPDVGVLQRSGSATDNQKAGESGRPTVATLEPPMQLETVMISWAPQRSLAIVDAEERKRVAAVELLSPSNKRVGGGRDEYLERRDHFLSGDVHLIEIDLLRRGTRLPTRSALPSMPYFAFLSRARRRPMTGVWPIGLREALPTIAVPLLPDDADVPLDLQAAFSGTYDAFGFDLELDIAARHQCPYRRRTLFGRRRCWRDGTANPTTLVVGRALPAAGSRAACEAAGSARPTATEPVTSGGTDACLAPDPSSRLLDGLVPRVGRIHGSLCRRVPGDEGG